MMQNLKKHSPLGQLPAFKKDPLRFLMEMEKTQRPSCQFRFGHKKVHLLMHPALIQEVLVKKADHFYKSKPFQELEPLLGQGLLLSEGGFHKQQRKTIQPSFTPKHVKQYGNQMGSIVKDRLQFWRDGERIISQDMMDLTLSIITKTMFGTDVHNRGSHVGKPLDIAMQISTERIRSVIKSPRSWKVGRNRVFHEAVKQLNEVLNIIIDNHDRDGDNLLSHLMSATDEEGKQMEKQQLRDEVMTIFLAGHETTASALTWTIHLLLAHQDVYQKVEQEVEEVVADTVPTYEETTKLYYTKKVIQESMRLYPPVWLFGRQANEDVNIGSTFVKRKSTVMISPYLMHRHRRYMDFPEDFLPDRFDEGRLGGVPDYVYLPFGGGSRVCIGQHFAMLEMLIVLPALIKNFVMRPPLVQVPIVTDPLITLRMKHGLKIDLKRK